MSRRRPLPRLTCVWWAVAIALQLGSCYRAEIDLSPLVDASGNGARAGDGAPGTGGSVGRGPSVNGEGAAGGGVDAGAASGGVGQGGAKGGEAAVIEGGVAGEQADLGGAGGWTLINQGGSCQDEPRGVEHEVCHLTGIKPGVKECAEADSSTDRWRGCYNGGCAVCTLHGELPGYPYYFDWHPCCSKNDTCSNHDPFVCNALCPAPTEHDKVAPCGKLDPNPG